MIWQNFKIGEKKKLHVEVLEKLHRQLQGLSLSHCSCTHYNPTLVFRISLSKFGGLTQTENEM